MRRVSTKDLAHKPVDLEVLISNGSRHPQRGRLSAIPSFTTLHSYRFQELWKVTLNSGVFVDGDCGSWVINAADGFLQGHIVSGYLGEGVAYIVPAIHVFLEDLLRSPGAAYLSSNVSPDMILKIDANLLDQDSQATPESAPSRTSSSTVLKVSIKTPKPAYIYEVDENGQRIEGTKKSAKLQSEHEAEPKGNTLKPKKKKESKSASNNKALTPSPITKERYAIRPLAQSTHDILPSAPRVLPDVDQISKGNIPSPPSQPIPLRPRAYTRPLSYHTESPIYGSSRPPLSASAYYQRPISPPIYPPPSSLVYPIMPLHQWSTASSSTRPLSLRFDSAPSLRRPRSANGLSQAGTYAQEYDDGYISENEIRPRSPPRSPVPDYGYKYTAPPPLSMYSEYPRYSAYPNSARDSAYESMPSSSRPTTQYDTRRTSARYDYEDPIPPPPPRSSRIHNQREYYDEYPSRSEISLQRRRSVPDLPETTRTPAQKEADLQSMPPPMRSGIIRNRTAEYHAYTIEDPPVQRDTREVRPNYRTVETASSRRSGLRLASIAYDLPEQRAQEASTSDRRSSSFTESTSANSMSDYEEKLNRAAAYYEEVIGPEMPLTVESLRRYRDSAKSDTASISSKDTRSSRASGSSRASRSTMTTASSVDPDDVTIRVAGARITVGGAEIDCQDGGEIQIERRRASSRARYERNPGIYGRRRSISRERGDARDSYLDYELDSPDREERRARMHREERRLRMPRPYPSRRSRDDTGENEEGKGKESSDVKNKETGEPGFGGAGANLLNVLSEAAEGL